MLNSYKTILSQKTQLTADVCLFHFDLIEPKEIKFSPGQYLMIKIPTEKGPVSRLYSIASSDTEKNSFELIIQIIPGGVASSYLSGLKVQDEVIFQGPAGMFVLRKNNRPKIFFATGTGIAPILSIIKSKFDSEIFLFWGLKNYKDVYLLEELKSTFAKASVDRQFKFKICLSREESLDSIPEPNKKYFDLGHIDSCFKKQFNPTSPFRLRGVNNFDFYLCARREIVESLRLFLTNKGVLRENIYFEKF